MTAVAVAAAAILAVGWIAFAVHTGRRYGTRCRARHRRA